MRDLVVLLLLAAILVPGIYFYTRWHGQPVGTQQTDAVAGASADAAKKNESTKRARMPIKSQARERKPGSNAGAGVATAAEVTVPVSERTSPGKTEIFINIGVNSSESSAKMPVYPFPAETELSRSMPRAQILTKFGSPNLTTTAIMRGNLQERYYYVKPDRTAMTVTVLQNGALASVYSTRP